MLSWPGYRACSLLMYRTVGVIGDIVIQERGNHVGPIFKIWRYLQRVMPGCEKRIVCPKLVKNSGSGLALGSVVATTYRKLSLAAPGYRWWSRLSSDELGALCGCPTVTCWVFLEYERGPSSVGRVPAAALQLVATAAGTCCRPEARVGVACCSGGRWLVAVAVVHVWIFLIILAPVNVIIVVVVVVFVIIKIHVL